MVLLRMLLGVDLQASLGELPDAYSSPMIFCIYLSVGGALGAFAGICSGLTLGLLSMSRVDLEVMRRTGSVAEKACAERIIPVVANQHYLLVTLLLCNAFAAEALPLVIDRMANPLVAIILSMTVLLIMGEIVPQAICKNYALEIGAFCTPLCRLLMFFSFPVAYPISKLLDWLLGEGHAAMFRRAQLEEFVDIHRSEEGMGGDLTETEVNIIKGALAFSSKVANEAMTPMPKVFMLSSETILSQATFNKILATGHSRIPIYRGEDRKEVIGVILVKELVGINPADKVPISHVTLRRLPVVSEETPMYDMLDLFENGGSHMCLLMSNLPLNRFGIIEGLNTTKSHFKLLARQNSLPSQRRKQGQRRSRAQGEAGAALPQEQASAWAQPQVPEDEPIPDEQVPAEAEQIEIPDPMPTGIITIEDCIEELIQNEIIDETDRYVDNDQVERVSAQKLVRRLPVRLRADFLKHFTPRHTLSNAALPDGVPGHSGVRRVVSGAQSLLPSNLATQGVVHSSPALASAGETSGPGENLTQPLLSKQNV